LPARSHRARAWFYWQVTFPGISLFIGWPIVALRGARLAHAAVCRASAARWRISRRASDISIITIGDNGINFHVHYLCFEMSLSRQ
jgi:hypothetical protein